MTISAEPQDYVAEDGLLYCGSCNTPKEAFFPNGRKLFGRDRHPAECLCRQAVREKQEAEEKARLHHENVRRLKLQGFTDWAMQHGINKELHQRMEEHRDLQKLVRKSSGKSKLQSKEIATKREIEQASGNIVRLESQKRSGYEQYVLGKISKEKFLELKQDVENEIEASGIINCSCPVSWAAILPSWTSKPRNSLH